MFERIYSLKIFEGIDKEIIDNIIKNCEVRKYLQGEIIIMEHEESNGEGYILKSGNVEIIIGGQKVAELGFGDIFGEIALLNEENRTATVRALK
ncbi:cyclic nucleotide-binding domain-containing protein, partial [Candidatus Gracilibacteria bacterium]